MSFERLSVIVPLAKEQARAVQYLMDKEGLCTCGRFLKQTDAKLCLAQLNTEYCFEKAVKNTMVIGAFCYDCASRINETLKYLKGLNKSNEPDRIRHEGK